MQGKIGKGFMRVLFLMFCFACCSSVTVYALLGIPQKINYQGILKKDGVLVNNIPPSTTEMRFQIIDLFGGLYWDSDKIEVVVTNGLFHHILDLTSPLPLKPIDWNTMRYYLKITVEGTELSPSEEMISVTTALDSGKLQGMSRGRCVEVVGVGYIPYADSDGNVAINTDDPDPAAKLHVAGTSRFGGIINTDNNWISGDGGAEGICVADNGWVGIGTTSPSNTVHAAASSGQANFAADALNTTTGAGFRLLRDGVMKGYMHLENAADDNMYLGIPSNPWVLTIANNGWVGIGQRNPPNFFSVFGDVASDYVGYVKNSNATNPGGLKVFTPNGDSSSGSICAFDVESKAGHLLSVLNNGNVGIGTTSPSYLLHVAGTKGMGISYNLTGSLLEIIPTADMTKIQLNCYAGIGVGKGDLNFTRSTGVDTILYLTESNRNVGIRTATPGYPLTCNGEPAANGYTAWTNYSDQRLKENVKGVENGIIDKIMKLKPATFNYNKKYYQITGYSKGEQKLCGFVAQEIQKVFPEMVNKHQIGKESYLDTNLTNLQIYLVKAIQEQQAIIKAQQLQIDELKIRLDKLAGKQ